MGTVVARNGRATTWSGEYELQLWDLDCIPRLRKNLPDLHNKDIEHLINELQLGNLNGKDTKRSCNCAMTGMSTTCLCKITARTTTLSKNRREAPSTSSAKTAGTCR